MFRTANEGVIVLIAEQHPSLTQPDELSSPIRDAASPSRRELAAIWMLIATAVVLALLPDIAGWIQSRPDHVYVGFSYNIDDCYVYMSWARQAFDGHFFARNLFTNAPQLGRQFNLFFLLLGNVCRVMHLPIVAGFEIARIGFGAALLWLIYRFTLWALPGSAAARLTSFALSSLGTGLGWIFSARWIHKNHDISMAPVDTWQPEGFTFLSLLLSSLFVVSTLLIVACIFFLLRAEERASWRDAVFAGLCAFVLGNIHSYDVLHIAAAWGLYLLVKCIALGKIDWAGWGRAGIAGLLCVPTVAYQFYLYRIDPIFHARAQVPTLSFGFWTYALGYGLTFFFALAAVVMLVRAHAFRGYWRSESMPLMLVCWVVGVFALVYMPASFQRKMIMGIHIPLCLLAGAAVAYTSAWLASRTKAVTLDFLPVLVVLLSIPSGLVWIDRDIRHINAGNSETQSPSFLTGDDYRVFDWIRANTKPTDSIAGVPSQMLFVPANCDRRVWCGHWGETPNYPEKVRETIWFSKGQLGDPSAFIEQTRAQYLVWPNDVTSAFPTPPDYLQAVYANRTYTIYHVL
ncbi:MAG: hypothetical protein P4L33_09550 [Capsulimonadaceae bacterium]|nr:hypothetical protein [Capsulimonadaceae bacterium]